MPKLYEYFGLLILFYSNEHEPIHVHAVDAGHVPPLNGARLKDFKALVKVRAEDIVRKWIDFFVFKKQVKMERITKRVK